MNKKLSVVVPVYFNAGSLPSLHERLRANLVQYLAGLLTLALLVEQVGVGERIAPIINVVLMVPLTFFLNRWFLRRGSPL